MPGSLRPSLAAQGRNVVAGSPQSAVGVDVGVAVASSTRVRVLVSSSSSCPNVLVSLRVALGDPGESRGDGSGSASERGVSTLSPCFGVGMRARRGCGDGVAASSSAAALRNDASQSNPCLGFPTG